MAPNENTLYLFTAKYPYGNKSETFLESEIQYLAKAFHSVVICPSEQESSLRTIPTNVQVDNVFTDIDTTKRQKLRLLFKHFFLIVSLFSSHARSQGSRKTLKNLKILLDIISVQLARYEALKSKGILSKKDIYYDYWFENSTLALSVAKKFGEIETFVARGHGFDIYDERWEEIGVPFRNFKLEHLDRLFLISEFGLRYMLEHSSSKFRNKYLVSRLGVTTQSKNLQTSRNEKKLVVSCSSMLDFKKVEKIPELLSKVESPIHWVHFGDGPMRMSVENAANDLPNHCSFELKGHVDNSEVLMFYQSHEVDLFISLSTSEGLPVSMMEAQSFGIPILAVRCGGIPEIVIEGKTGFLLPENFEKLQYSKILKQTLITNFSEEQIRSFFEAHFDASKNYVKFARDLKRL